MALAEDHQLLITSSLDCTVRVWTLSGHYVGMLAYYRSHQNTWRVFGLLVSTQRYRTREYSPHSMTVLSFVHLLYSLPEMDLGLVGGVEGIDGHGSEL